MLIKHICKCDRCREEYETRKRENMELNGIKYDLCLECEKKMVELEKRLYSVTVIFPKDSISTTSIPEFMENDEK